MARDNESTMKWKLDIADLKKGMQDARNQIKLANAEFKNATAGMGRWSESATGVAAKTKQLKTALAGQKTILEDLQRQYKLVADNMGETSPEAQRLKIQIENQEAAVKRTEKQLEDYNAQLEDLQAQEKEADTEFGKLTSTIDEQEKQLAELKDEYAKAAINFGENSDEAQGLAQQISDLSSDLRDNRQTLENATTAADGFDQSLEDVNDSASDTGGLDAMKVALGNLIADGFRAAIEAMKDFVGETIEVGKAFDTSMSNVAALSGASGEELEMLRDTAKEFGSTTQFSASQAADALGFMALAGWDAQQSADALGGVLDLAASSGMELGAASDMVTDYLSAFGLEAQDSGRFADMLAFAQANANTTAQGLGEAFKNCAANMNAAGQDVETTTAFLSMMANQGLKGSEAGTALSAVMRDMTAKMEDGAIAIGDTSVQIMDANGNYRDLTDILADVEAATDGMGDAERAAALSSTFTADSIKGLNLILNAGTGEAASFEEQLRHSDGAAGDMAKTMNDNLGGDLTALGSKLEGVQIAIYEKFEPALRDGVEALSGLLDAFSWLVDNSDLVVAALGAIAAGVAGYLAYTTALTVMTQGWQALTVVTKAQAAAQAALNAVMALNPIGILIGLIAALVAAFVILFNKNEEFRAKVIEVWGNVKEFVSAAVDAIKIFFTETVPQAIDKMLEWFRQLPEKVGAYLSSVIAKAKAWASQMASNALAAGKNFIDNVINYVKQLPEKVRSWLSDAASKVVAWGNDLKQKAADAAKKLYDAVVEGVKSLPDKMLEVGGNLVTGIWNGISNSLGWIKGKISGWVGDVTSFIKNLFGIHSPSRVMRDEVGKMLARGIAVGFGDEMPKVLTSMQRDMGGVVDGLRGDVSLAANGIAGGSYSASIGAGGVGSTVGGVGVQNVIFNQTINSPNAIDRLSIYRDTKSILFTAKGGLQHV